MNLHRPSSRVTVRAVVLAGGSALAAIASPAHAGLALCQLPKLVQPAAATSDLFGSKVALNGDVAVAASLNDDEQAPGAGSASVFRRSAGGGPPSWNFEQKLVASDGAAFDLFGADVAVDGDVMLIGACLDDAPAMDAGSAYAFRSDGATWVQEQKLVASDGQATDNFGFSVSLSGDFAIIGAWNDDDLGANAGAAYIFRFDGAAWVQEQKLVASDGFAADRFGTKVGISSSSATEAVAIVGATGNDDLGSSSGSAYMWRRVGASWIEEQKLLPGDGQMGDFFGASVGIDGEVVIVGAYADDDTVNASGSAYIFRATAGVAPWVQEAKLVAGDPGNNDQFGSAVAIDDDVAGVGAYLNDDNGTDSGSAYMFQREAGVWSQTHKFTASDAAAGDYFGAAVAVDGEVLFVGAYQDDDAGLSSGSAYVIEPCPPPPPGDLDGDLDVDGADLGLLLGAWGSADPVADINDDGTVDGADMGVMLGNWG